MTRRGGYHNTHKSKSFLSKLKVKYQTVFQKFTKKQIQKFVKDVQNKHGVDIPVEVKHDLSDIYMTRVITWIHFMP